VYNPAFGDGDYCEEIGVRTYHCLNAAQDVDLLVLAACQAFGMSLYFADVGSDTHFVLFSITASNNAFARSSGVNVSMIAFRCAGVSPFPQ
jgi:hypothetical protein